MHGDGSNNSVASDDEKSHTFRKRRLSLTNLSAAAREQNPHTSSPSSPPPHNNNINNNGSSNNEVLQEGAGGSPAAAAAAAAYSSSSPGGTATAASETASSPSARAHTFRKRRLSLTQNTNLEAPEEEAEAPEEAGAQTIDDDDDQERQPAQKKQRRDSTASLASCTSYASSSYTQHNNKRRFPSKILHSGELLAGGHPQTFQYYTGGDGGGGGNELQLPNNNDVTSGKADSSNNDQNGAAGMGTAAAEAAAVAPTMPPSPAVRPDNVLYRTQYTQPRIPAPPFLALPPGSSSSSGNAPGAVDGGGAASASATTAATTPADAGAAEPKWKKRHTIGHDEVDDNSHRLPFPRDVVGTYSCHGIEPIYDDDEEEDEDVVVGANNNVDEGWDSPNINGGSDAQQQQQQTPQPPVLEEPQPVIMAKINQDRGGVAFPYGNCPRTALFAVYDGHGMGGELVSQFALHEVQRRLERHRKFTTDLERAFKETFVQVDEALKEEPLIEPLYAGTTAVVALLKDQKLTVANAGDSRAVVARRCRRKEEPDEDIDGSEEGANINNGGKCPTREESEWEAIPLTEDQNPDLPQERARVVNAGGYVTDAPAPGLSARVWLDRSCTQIGLAMSRSIGDHAVTPVGVIAESTLR